MDYALRYLPALGLLMLSGHIRKGDQIDLPVPHPEAWAEAIAYVYTGLGQPGVKARENVEYLGGVVDVSGDGKDEATKDGEKDGESET